RAGQPQAAVAHAHRAVELDEGNAAYLGTLGVALAEAGDYGDAEIVLRGALELKPRDPGAHFNLAKLLRKQERVAEALEAFARAYAIEPGLAGVREALCEIHRARGEAARALRILDEAAGAA